MAVLPAAALRLRDGSSPPGTFLCWLAAKMKLCVACDCVLGVKRGEKRTGGGTTGWTFAVLRKSLILSRCLYARCVHA